jgi:hypothetical protein
MALPWHLALKAIPWSAILANAPALAQSARALLSETGARRDARESPAAMDTLAERIAALERRDRDTAELVAQLVAQNTALMTATEVLVARVRWLLVATGLAAALAAAAMGVAIVAF